MILSPRINRFKMVVYLGFYQPKYILKVRSSRSSFLSRCALPPGVTLLDGNATANVDFASAPTEVHFQSGQQELSRDIVIYDDDLLEGKEVFIARLMHP